MAKTPQPTQLALRLERPDAAVYAPKTKRRTRGAPPFAIQAFVGANGGGKTLAVVELVAIPAWEEGRLVVSNMTLRPEALGYSPDLYQPLRSWRDIVNMGRCQEPEPCEPGECEHSATRGRACALILDEASAALPSRESGAVPPQLLRVLNQLRKRDVSLAWTAPAYGRMDKGVREVTQAVTVCTGLLPDTYARSIAPGDRRWFPRKERDDDGRPVRIKRSWAPNRLFTWITYEAMSYDEFTLGKTQQLRPRSRRSYWRTRHQAMHAYGTLEGVDMLDHLDATGACMDCGKKRRTVFCECGEAGKATAAGRAGRPVGGGRTSSPSAETNRHGIPRLQERVG